jgi:copper resistance protein B
MSRVAAALLGVSLLVTTSAALAQNVERPSTPSSPSTRADAQHISDLNDHAQTFSLVRSQLGYAAVDDADVFSWDDTDAWVGGDYNKFWFKSEGEVRDGEVERAEVQALWSRNVATYFDAQVGLRYDFEPEETAYLVVGLQGLAPYQFETDLAAFLSEEGDVSVRFEQGLDLLLTQRLVLEPEIELTAYAQDVAAQNVGAGFSEVEAALQLRYEITRKFAPFVEVAYERRLGETAGIARRSGDETEETSIRTGLRVWF